MQQFNSNGADRTKSNPSNDSSRFSVPETNPVNHVNPEERKGLSGIAIGIILLIIGAVMIGIIIFVAIFIGIIAIAVSGSKGGSEVTQDINAEETENWQDYAILDTDNPRMLPIITKEEEQDNDTYSEYRNGN